MAKQGETAQRILAIAQRMIQSEGYNGFSFRDIAAEIGIKSASVHYHFATKGDLGAAVAARYAARFVAWLERIVTEGHDTRHRLILYVGLFRAAVVEDGRMCLCGMLGAESESLPPEVLDEARQFFTRNLAWLGNVFESGAADGTLIFTGSAEDHARLMLAALEGAMVFARVNGDPATFDQIAETALARYTR
ncbi:MAG TPA: TetR/AcrR family transcriptional regulator [Alphaproteobacteria bacterium]|nr:TetR/AcrR family transcriptional regulator [Alphaproteobacteria bacterium]